MSTGREIPLKNLILDVWSVLGHKNLIGDTDQTIPANYLPSWVPPLDQRRLQAYLIFDGYRKNRAGLFITNASWDQIRAHREYGDASLISGRIAHGVLGDDWELVVDGADDDLSEGPDLPPAPEDPGENATDGQRRVFDLLTQRHADDEAAVIDDWEQRFISQPVLAARQDDLREWADTQGLASKLVECEDDCVALGDTLLALFPQGENAWPELRRYDPDSYFPVLTDSLEGDPDVVHVAWEFCDDTGPAPVQRLRRLTWRMVDLAELGEVPRAVPWSDEPVTRTCLFSEGVWSMDRIGPNGIPDLSENAAVWEVDAQGEVRDRDLMVDELPVIHVPNTPASRTHFGASCLGAIAQVLDDLGQADTDLMETARLVAAPAIALSGADTAGDLAITPLTVFKLGADGQMTILDLSIGLEKMIGFRDGLRDRALVNGHVTKTLVGWTASDSAPSGIALLIDAAPFAQLIGTLRMTREPAHRRMLSLAQKMAMVSKAIEEPGPVAPARVAYGNFLPLDRTQVVTEVVTLVGAKIISKITGIQILMASGLPIDDAKRELEAVEREDVEAAKTVADATGSEQAAADRLGITLPEKPKPPEITLPPPPNQPPQEP